MRQDYLVSLIVPVYNEEATIELFIQTIKAKIFPEQEHLEVVFFDDGSKDRSAEIIHELMAQEEKLRRSQDPPGRMEKFWRNRSEVRFL